MRTDLIALKLADARLGQLGKTIFTGTMPATAQAGLLVKSPLTGTRVDPYLPGLYHPQFQIIVRATNDAFGNDMAQRVTDTLWVETRTDWIDPKTGEVAMVSQHIIPDTLPIQYPRSDGNGIEWSINFNAAIWMPR